MSWKKHRFAGGWLLEKLRSTKTSYVLTVPPNYSSSFCQNKLKHIPGGTGKFITIGNCGATEIYFISKLDFKGVVKWLANAFSLQYNEKKSPGNSRKKRKISQYTPDGQYIKTWDSLLQASSELNINPGNICNAAKGSTKTAGGWCWKYENN